jgi:hypothetical protein
MPESHTAIKFRTGKLGSGIYVIFSKAERKSRIQSGPGTKDASQMVDESYIAGPFTKFESSQQLQLKNGLKRVINNYKSNYHVELDSRPWITYLYSVGHQNLLCVHISPVDPLQDTSGFPKLCRKGCEDCYFRIEDFLLFDINNH